MNTKSLRQKLKQDVGPLTFGMFLRVARNSLDMSQAALAKKLGIARGTLCDIEKGRQLVSPTLAVKIARVAGLSEKTAVKACLQDQLAKAEIEMKVELVA